MSISTFTLITNLYNWLKTLSNDTNYTNALERAYNFYKEDLNSLGDQVIFGTLLGIFALVAGLGVVVWDWLPLDFRLLFIGKAEDYDWDLPYNF